MYIIRIDNDFLNVLLKVYDFINGMIFKFFIWLWLLCVCFEFVFNW